MIASVDGRDKPGHDAESHIADAGGRCVGTLSASTLSWPGLSRPSTFFGYDKKGVEARHKAGHDGW